MTRYFNQTNSSLRNEAKGNSHANGRFFLTLNAALLILLLLLAPATACADQPFRQHRYDLFRYLSVDSNDIVFLGNSITDMHNWDEAFVGLPRGVRILNRGVSGALTDDILCHLDDILPSAPRQIFLMIGTNDLGTGRTPRQVADSVVKIISSIKARFPRTQLVLQSILPSRVGQRTIQDEQEANRLLRAIADTLGVRYLDLWPLLGSLPDDDALSFDGLHLTAEGYRLWCQAVAPLLGPDVCITYPSNTAAIQQHGTLWGSNAMRATYCSLHPVADADILFFGDEMVKCGEWNELIYSVNDESVSQSYTSQVSTAKVRAEAEIARVMPSAGSVSKATLRNRGTGWGYDGTAPSIATTRQLVAATLSSREAEPRAIILYTGTGDINSAHASSGMPNDGSRPMPNAQFSTLNAQLSYAALVADIRSYCPHSPLILLSLMPKAEADSLVIAFNAHLRRLADSLDNCRYIDIHTPLSNPDGTADTAYIRDNYLYGRGYRLVADSLQRAISDTEVAFIDAADMETHAILPFDYTTLLHLQQSRTPQWNRHWVTVSNTIVLSVLPTAGLFVGSRTTTDPVTRTLLGYEATEAAVSLLLTAATASAVKSIVRRPRPYKQYPDDLQCLQPVIGYSFPSSHTSFSFSAATTLTLLYPKWYVALPAYLWAASVGFSRLYIGAHYPTDVLSGVVLGTACALVAHGIYKRVASNAPVSAPQAFTLPVAITF